jgi:hypothetical protein
MEGSFRLDPVAVSEPAKGDDEEVGEDDEADDGEGDGSTRHSRPALGPPQPNDHHRDGDGGDQLRCERQRE